jgi:polyferredoxin
MASALPIAGQEKAYQPNSRFGMRQLRRAVQLFFLFSWIAVFLLTRQQLESGVPDLFLLTDPLVAALTMGASQIIVPTMAVSLIFVVFTLVFGRAFCGWICPLGTLIDLSARILRPREDRFSQATHHRMQQIKYLILTVMIFGAIFSAQWIYLLDPLVLLFRGMTAGVYPALNAVVPESWLSDGLRMNYHGVAFAPVALLLGVLLLTGITPRFYCRYLCPLGAFYGLLSRAPLLRRRVTGCDGCHAINTEKECVTGCRMGAVPANHYTQNHECIRCMSGRSFCHKEAIHFDWHKPKGPEKKDSGVDIDRRQFLVAGATGIAAAPLATLSEYHRGEQNEVIRPPCVTSEKDFTDQCIRCAMCVQSCPTQTLQLTHLEAGVAGFWTPAVTPQVGGCKAECNACAEACPTDAIPMFQTSEMSKWGVKMGTVVLQKDLCICFTDNSYCGECIDVCPTKAFVIEPAHGDVPRRPDAVEYFRCVGCGLCEVACRNIVFGEPALKTFAHGRGNPTTLWEHPTETYEPKTLKVSAPKAVPKDADAKAKDEGKDEDDE